MTKGFTLAETLITLIIIGVIAALTIPTLVTNHRDKQIVAQLKKVYSTLSQAHKMSQISGKNLDSLMKKASSKAEAAKVMLEYFEPYFNIVKTCTSSSDKGCFPEGVTYKRLNGKTYGILDNYTDRVNARLADGTSIAFFTWSNGGCKYTFNNLTKVCGQFYVDINGDKGPNVQGIDYFSFYITKNQVVPEGMNGDVAEMVKDDCLDTSTAQGWNCAAWVLYKENLDYLNCNDLDWNTKTSCK